MKVVGAGGAVTHVACNYDVVTLDDILAASKEMWSSPNWDTTRYELTDARDVTSHTLREEDALQLAHMDNAAFLSSRRMKVAIVAKEPSVLELCEAYVESVKAWKWQAQIFDDMDAAREWATS